MLTDFDQGGISFPPEPRGPYPSHYGLAGPSRPAPNPLEQWWGGLQADPKNTILDTLSSFGPFGGEGYRKFSGIDSLGDGRGPLERMDWSALPEAALELLAFASGPKKPRARPGKAIGDVYDDLVKQGKTPEEAGDMLRKQFGDEGVQRWAETGQDVLGVSGPAKIADLPVPPAAPAIPQGVKRIGERPESKRQDRLSRSDIDLVVQHAGFKNVEEAAQAIESGILHQPDNVSKADWSRLRAAVMAEAKRDRRLGPSDTTPLEDTLAQSIRQAEIEKSTRVARGEIEDVVPSQMSADDFRAALEGKKPGTKSTAIPKTLKAEDFLSPEANELLKKKIVSTVKDVEEVQSPGKNVVIGEGYTPAHQEVLFMDDGTPLPPPAGSVPPGKRPGQLTTTGGEEVIDRPGLTERLGQFKSIQSSSDISATARQALPFLASHPIASAKAFSEQMKNIWKGYKHAEGQSTYLDNLTSEQMQRTMQNGGRELYFSRQGGGVVSGEEAFQSTGLFDRLRNLKGPFGPVGRLIAETVERSEAGYIAMLNTVRSESFNGVVEANKRLVDRLISEGDLAGAQAAKMTQSQLDDLAWVINHASGRGFSMERGAEIFGKKIGDASDLQAVSKLANVFLFSPQFRVSRFAFIKDVLDGLKNVTIQSAEILDGQRRYIDPNEIEKVRLGLGYIAGVSGLLYMLHESLGTSERKWLRIQPNPLEPDFGFWIDSTHSDFGKVNIGKAGPDKTLPVAGLELIGAGVQTDEFSRDVMVDIMAGESQAIRLLARGLHYAFQAGESAFLPGSNMLGGKSDMTSHSGKKTDLNDLEFGDRAYMDLIHNYIDSGAAPGYRLATEFFTDASKFFEASVENPLLQLLQPIWFQGTIEASGQTSKGRGGTPPAVYIADAD